MDIRHKFSLHKPALQWVNIKEQIVAYFTLLEVQKAAVNGVI